MHSETVLLAQQGFMSLLILFLAGTLGGKLADRLRLPDVVIFMITGLLLGPGLFAVIDIPTQSLVNQMILLFGASFIIFHGGVITSFDILKKVWITITLLSTTGVLITAVLVAAAAVLVFGIPFPAALLLGAILASTDPAALVPIFQRFPVRPKVAQTVISESAFTDATGAILTTVVFGALTASTSTGGVGPGEVTLQFLWLAGGGMAAGGVVGLIAAFLISENDKGLLKEFTPLVTVITVLSAYLLAEHVLHSSGFMAVFTAGLMIGNARSFRLTILPKEEHAAHAFIDAISLKLRMLIFILLGSQVDFGVLQKYGLPALLVVGAFIFIARPATVAASLLPDRGARWTGPELIFFCWTRETGVIAAALVGILSSTGFEYAELISAVTFVAILATLLLQAGTTPLLARKLGLLEHENPAAKAE